MKENKSCFLVGNPNSGKSSLFHKLTGVFQKVANYPGVTTEKKVGVIHLPHRDLSVTDLPGCYSLYPNSIDEKVVLEELLYNTPDFVIFVADATQLSRSLLLLSQVSDLNIPIVLVLNMMDELKAQGETINIDLLKVELNIPIFVCNSRTGKGVKELKDYLDTHTPDYVMPFFGEESIFSQHLDKENVSYRQWHDFVSKAKPNAIIENTKRREIIYRYNKIENILSLVIRPTAEGFKKKKWTDRADKYLLHPVWGTLILVAILYFVFQLLFTFASYPMEWLDMSFGFASEEVKKLPLSPLWKNFVSNAIIPGIAGILIFIPQIALLFIMNTILEESGYMSRIVFLSDKLMRQFGMSGKSILPLVSGNACAIPAIASTKAIPTHRERLITIMAIPFMTCSARLPVYTLIISLIFPLPYQGLMLLGLYLLGTFSAMIFGWILTRFIKTNEKSMLIMEVPSLRLPSGRNILINVKNAVVPFVKTAGKYIFTMSLILWFLGSFTLNNTTKLEQTDIEHSMLSSIGKTIEPAFKPLGYDWKISVSLLSSFAAREVFVSTLATLYHIDSEEATTIIENIRHQKRVDSNELIFSFGVGLSLLLFYAFALQCMSTLASMKKETGTWKYSLISFAFMFLLAYLSSFLAFQAFG